MYSINLAKASRRHFHTFLLSHPIVPVPVVPIPVLVPIVPPEGNVLHGWCSGFAAATQGILSRYSWKVLSLIVHTYVDIHTFFSLRGRLLL